MKRKPKKKLKLVIGKPRKPKPTPLDVPWFYTNPMGLEIDLPLKTKFRIVEN